jgi:hypothetical protein
MATSQTIGDLAIAEVEQRVKSSKVAKLKEMRPYFAHVLSLIDGELERRKQEGEP